MTTDEKRKALLIDGTTFTVSQNAYLRTVHEYKIDRFSAKNDEEEDCLGLAVRRVSGITFDSMNIEKIGSKTISFYTFNLFGKKFTQVIYFTDVTITTVGGGD